MCENELMNTPTGRAVFILKSRPCPSLPESQARAADRTAARARDAQETGHGARTYSCHNPSRGPTATRTARVPRPVLQRPTVVTPCTVRPRSTAAPHPGPAAARPYEIRRHRRRRRRRDFTFENRSARVSFTRAVHKTL